MLICEELLLLLLKDSGALESWAGNDQLGLRGAVLLDLVLAGRLSLTSDKHPRIQVASTEPIGHPALDEALAALPAKDGKKLSSVISWGKLKPRDGIAASLIAAGVVERTTGGLFGMASRFPTVNPVPEQATRERLVSVLHGERAAGPADLALLGILQSMGLASKILPSKETGMRGGDVKRMIKSLRIPGQPDDAVARAIKDAIDAVDAAVVAVTTVVVTAN